MLIRKLPFWLVSAVSVSPFSLQAFRTFFDLFFSSDFLMFLFSSQSYHLLCSYFFLFSSLSLSLFPFFSLSLSFSFFHLFSSHLRSCARLGRCRAVFDTSCFDGSLSAVKRRIPLLRVGCERCCFGVRRHLQSQSRFVTFFKALSMQFASSLVARMFAVEKC